MLLVSKETPHHPQNLLECGDDTVERDESTRDHNEAAVKEDNAMKDHNGEGGAEKGEVHSYREDVGEECATCARQ